MNFLKFPGSDPASDNAREVQTKPGRFLRIRSLTLAIAVLASISGLAACTTASSTGTAAESSPSEQIAGDSNALSMDPAINAQLPESIRSAGVLKVGIDPTYAPMEFTDEANNIIGSDPELIEAMGVVLGVKVEYLPTKFASLIPTLKSGRFDVGMNVGDYFHREKNADFIDFFVSKRAFLIDSSRPQFESITDVCGLTVGMLQGTDSQDKIDEANPKCTAAGKPSITANAYQTNNDAVLAMSTGRIDAIFADTPTTGWTAKQSNGKYVTSGTSLWATSPYYGMIVAKGSPLSQPLEAALNKVIDSGRYEEIFTKWGLEDGLIEKAVINGAKE
ncbi:transporter substrate-binding domain-containing protein [Paeniglutamicibacter sp. MACA_103]|uniref:ABC transporter substrate-binding protein n=1 Tax=Paeniglutamicibacter sp. MACA_103 TaxID=3377337 RepID=UPI003894DF3B